MSERPTRSWRLRALVEGVLPALVAVVGLAGHHLTAGPADSSGGPDGLGYLLLGVGAATLLARHRFPLSVLGATTIGVAIALAFDVTHEGPFILLPVLVALYTASETGQRTPAVFAAATILATFGLTLWMASTSITEDGWLGLVWAAGWLAAAIVTGEVVKGRRAYLTEVEARALEAERTRESQARRRADEERLRIAREVHDVLGHSLSVINVQAGTAAHVAVDRPDTAQEALEAIRRTSKQALADLRSTLGALQDPDEAPPLGPVTGLARIGELTEPISAAGLDVDLVITGRARPLAIGIDQAAFRIVQESLTNVLRHADTRSAAVRLDYGEHALDIEVKDQQARVFTPGQLEHGTGITGMRERATAMGGELEVHTPATGGVRIVARLPLGGAA